jgi:hypothetical protein
LYHDPTCTELAMETTELNVSMPRAAFSAELYVRPPR